MMDVLLYIFVGFSVAFPAFMAGYLFGSHKERKDWNKLVERGILPKPRNVTRNQYWWF